MMVLMAFLLFVVGDTVRGARRGERPPDWHLWAASVLVAAALFSYRLV